MMITAALTVAALVLTAAPADAAPKAQGFMRMFPNLAGLNQATQQQLADLAQTMLDPNNDSENNTFGSGFTYFGQFLDHDLTLDTSPPPTAPRDPAADGSVNGRTFAFDLDSVYGGGPGASPQLYDGDRFRLQLPNPNGVRDYIRNADGSAVINEARNDENEIISQFQVAMMLAHNRLIDEGLSFRRAQATLTEAYHQAITGDYLPHTICGCVADKTVKKLDPKKNGDPLEFAAAAFRFGHSQVRRAYEMNETSGKIQVFSFTQPDLRGGRNIPAGRQIAWGNFFADLTDPDDQDGINFSRKIDTLISSSLFQLPIPGAEATGSNVLAFRNMSRAGFYNIPSGQAVATALGIAPIAPAVLNLGPAFDGGTPLWYYVLYESQVIEGGLRMGPVGSAIVEASFDAAMKNAKVPPGQVDKAKLAEIVGPDRVMTVSDLPVFAGVAERP